MKTFTTLAFAFACFAGNVLAQTDFEYGKPADLKGLTKIYVQTMADLKENERIVSRLQKAKVPDLVIVENIDDAEIVLMFGGDEFTSVSGANSSTVGGSTNTLITRVNLLTGEGRVYVASKDGSKPKLVMRVQNEQQTKLEKRPVTKFVENFIKVYKKVNDIKE